MERYPEWAADVKEAMVLERDSEGRPRVVRFRAAAFGRSTSYTLAYDYSQAPKVLSWVEIQGDLTRHLDGSYVFEPAGPGETRVSYHLEVELKVPIPGFVKRRAESRVRRSALLDFERRVEELSRA